MPQLLIPARYPQKLAHGGERVVFGFAIQECTKLLLAADKDDEDKEGLASARYGMCLHILEQIHGRFADGSKTWDIEVREQARRGISAAKADFQTVMLSK